MTSVSRLKEMREPAPWISGKVHSSRESTKAPRRDMPGVLRESPEAMSKGWREDDVIRVGGMSCRACKATRRTSALFRVKWGAAASVQRSQRPGTGKGMVGRGRKQSNVLGGTGVIQAEMLVAGPEGRVEEVRRLGLWMYFEGGDNRFACFSGWRQ